MRIIFSIIFLSLSLYSIHLLGQDLLIYQLQTAYTNMEDEITTGFISLSDQYKLVEHPDSLAIPQAFLNAGREKRTIPLNGTYRKQLLNQTNIKESDVVSIYAYKQQEIFTFKVKDLKTLAILSPYEMLQGEKSQYDYQIGFEINPDSIPGEDNYYDGYLVYIGNNKPFKKNSLQPIRWEQVDSTCFPSKNKRPKPLASNIYIKGKTFEFVSDNYLYYIQNVDLLHAGTFARHLAIVNRENNQIVLSKFYTNSEGSSLESLNIENDNLEMLNQWTGQLFKDSSPVVFGFLYMSFGCPRIYFIDQSSNSIYINCDNRH